MPMNQYSDTLVSRVSSGSGWAGSVHSLNFSTIQASCPAGESVSP